MTEDNLESLTKAQLAEQYGVSENQKKDAMIAEINARSEAENSDPSVPLVDSNGNPVNQAAEAQAEGRPVEEAAPEITDAS